MVHDVILHVAESVGDPVAEEAAQTLFFAAKLLARGNFVASEVLPLS